VFCGIQWSSVVFCGKKKHRSAVADSDDRLRRPKKTQEDPINNFKIADVM
jgi:hypothetical protein